MENNEIMSGVVTFTGGVPWKFCPECGTKLDVGWKHCTECGQAIGHQAAPITAPWYPIFPATYPVYPVAPYQPPGIMPCGPFTPTYPIITCGDPNPCPMTTCEVQFSDNVARWSS